MKTIMQKHTHTLQYTGITGSETQTWLYTVWLVRRPWCRTLLPGVACGVREDGRVSGSHYVPDVWKTAVCELSFALDSERLPTVSLSRLSFCHFIHGHFFFLGWHGCWVDSLVCWSSFIQLKCLRGKRLPRFPKRFHFKRMTLPSNFVSVAAGWWRRCVFGKIIEKRTSKSRKIELLVCHCFRNRYCIKSNVYAFVHVFQYDQ